MCIVGVQLRFRVVGANWYVMPMKRLVYWRSNHAALRKDEDIATSIPLFVLSLDIFSRVILHHRGGDQGQDRADENVDSDRIGGVKFY